MGVFKRNAVILTVLLFVCVAVYLNWSYNKRQGDLDAMANPTGDLSAVTATDSGDGENSGLFYEEEGGAAESGYFDTIRLNRQQAKDAAVTTLSAVSETNGASQETIDAALTEILSIASNTMLESKVESLIIAKGFADCVVYISEDGITVSVPAPQEGLPVAAVARITDIVVSETSFTPSNLNITEIKGA